MSYFTKTGAELRALAGTNDAAAIAEIARRAAKPATTVAQLRSRGQEAAAKARVEAAKASAPAKAPKAPKVALTPVTPIANAPKAVAFTRTSERVEQPKGAVANLHNRLCAVEGALVKLAEMQARQTEILARIAK